jgi:hypothetical protein
MSVKIINDSAYWCLPLNVLDDVKQVTEMKALLDANFMFVLGLFTSISAVFSIYACLTLSEVKLYMGVYARERRTEKELKV